MHNSKKLFAISVNHTNPDQHVRTKVKTFRYPRGVWGASPHKPKNVLKKSTEMKAFPLRRDFCFTLQGSLDPQNYELAPKSLKIITSAPQLPENIKPFSPDPQNPWGPLFPAQGTSSYLHAPIRRTAHLFSVIPANDRNESMFGHRNFPIRERGSILGPLLGPSTRGNCDNHSRTQSNI